MIHCSQIARDANAAGRCCASFSLRDYACQRAQSWRARHLADVLIFTAARLNSAKAKQLQKAGVELVRIRRTKSGLDIRAVLSELARREILSVMIEAGTAVNSSALLARVVDKLVIFGAEKVAGTGGKPWVTKRAAARLYTLSALRMQRFGPDQSYTGYLRDVYRNH